MPKIKAKRKRACHEFWCQECGKSYTAKGAERAYYGDGCAKCGGADFDCAPPKKGE